MFGGVCVVKNDVSGLKFNRLTVIGRDDAKRKRVFYLCKCDCGNLTSVEAGKLKAGHTKSCGCLQSETVSQRRSKNLLGNRYSNLVVHSLSGVVKGSQYWNCNCDCGGTTSASTTSLTTGNKKSCGCLISSGEAELEKYLKLVAMAYEKQVKFADCKNKLPLPFDFGIYTAEGKLLFLVELQGEQHYHPFTFNGEANDKKLANLKKLQHKDMIKKRYCIANNIPLVEIRYTMYYKAAEIVQAVYDTLLGMDETAYKQEVARINSKLVIFDVEYADYTTPKVVLGVKGKDNVRSKQVCQVNLDTASIVRLWDSLGDIQRELGYSSGAISEICNSKPKVYQVQGFGWFYYNPDTLDADIARVVQLSKTEKAVRGTAILEIDKETGLVVKEWRSALQINKVLGYCNETILQACKGKLRTPYNRVWCFKTEPDIDTFIKMQVSPRRGARRILQIDPSTGETVHIWDSISAIKCFNKSSVTACCNGQRLTNKGFKWEYGEAW